MGLSDRGYYREEQSESWLGNRSMVLNLIIINVVIYVADFVMKGDLNSALRFDPDLLSHPWHFYQLLTYGFVHNPKSILHILFNMYGLWLFGNDVEGVYGRAEFLRIYLSTIVVVGLVWVVAQFATGDPSPLIGASGGVMGIMILFVLHFPQRTFIMFPIPIPIEAWALGAGYVALDLFRASQDDGVAHLAHLTGAAYGFLYMRSGWNLGSMIPRRFSTAMFKLRPQLKIHDPTAPSRDLSAQVDEILEKISREGEASLTKKERRTLEEASRRYQRRRQ